MGEGAAGVVDEAVLDLIDVLASVNDISTLVLGVPVLGHLDALALDALLANQGADIQPGSIDVLALAGHLAGLGSGLGQAFIFVLRGGHVGAVGQITRKASWRSATQASRISLARAFCSAVR